ncbi:MAG: hypothetical protein KJ970_01005 [Candidatus Eisenbacteria bacterium]|uniref:Uncharacterized protein n=1 Tax=Eiseniibacteriota bacterium TaxID=2212470 RepID=A0A948RWD2_UNCEI|nr:hypothetical protein [Candidatus Eisenbacteria bacterium]MBU1948991.1 hypothetical protein [Candidatus Eisenbacteria bacterium]MBU2689479.1 hypothetical protein [Candidatus Eisenbacteria bacterium]
MRRCPALLFIFLMLTFNLSCSEDGSTEPGGSNNGGDDYTLAETATIGPLGGTMATEDFSLTIPAGAFNLDVKLDLYVSSEADPFGDHGTTMSFRLEGLPDDYAEPLELSIKSEGSLSGDLAMGIGEEMLLPESDSTAVVYDLVTAEESSGYLVCTLPVDEAPPKANHKAGGKAVPTTKHRYYTGVFGYATYVRSDHFVICYPASYPAYIDLIVPLLEDSYDAILDQVGLHFPGYNFRKPLKVIIFQPAHELHAKIYFSQDQTGYVPVLYVDPLSLTQQNSPAVRLKVGHELLKAAQNLYIYAATNPPADPAYWWFHRSLRSWAEELFADDSNYTKPAGFDTNPMAAFGGLQAPGQGLVNGLKHSHGMSAVFKYLMTDPGFGPGGIFGVYYRMMTENVTSLDALDEKIESPLETWWPGFFKKYMDGELYAVNVDLFKDLESGAWDIQGPDDSPAEFYSRYGIGNYPDLSARIFSVGLTSYDFDDDDVIKFTATSPTVEQDFLTVLAYAWKPGDLLYIGHASALQIGDIPILTDAGYTDILAVVVNSDGVPPFTNTAEVDLLIELTTEAPLTHAQIAAGNIRCMYRDEYSDTPELNNDHEGHYWTGNIPVAIQASQTAENTWIGGWNRIVNEGEVYKGSVEIVLDETRDTILSVTVHTEYTDEVHEYEKVMDLSAKNIGRYSDYWQVEGDEIIANNEVTLESVEIGGTKTTSVLYITEGPDALIFVKLY